MHDRFRFAQIKVPEFMGPEPLGSRVSDRLQWGKFLVLENIIVIFFPSQSIFCKMLDPRDHGVGLHWCRFESLYQNEDSCYFLLVLKKSFFF
jgi:hypothetical protein